MVGGRSEETESDRQQAPRTNHTRAPSPNSAPSKLTNQRILHLLPPVGCHHVSLDRSLTTNTLSHSRAAPTPALFRVGVGAPDEATCLQRTSGVGSFASVPCRVHALDNVPAVASSTTDTGGVSVLCVCSMLAHRAWSSWTAIRRPAGGTALHQSSQPRPRRNGGVHA